MDTENHNDSSNQRDIRNNTVEAMDTEEGKFKHIKEKTHHNAFALTAGLIFYVFPLFISKRINSPNQSQTQFNS